jgi:antitoxin PrlF
MRIAPCQNGTTDSTCGSFLRGAGVKSHYILEKQRASMESTLTAKGQVTIPKPIRDHLNLSPGDRIKFFLHLDGTVVILPKLPSSALKGILSSRKGRPPAVPEKQAARSQRRI